MNHCTALPSSMTGPTCLVILPLLNADISYDELSLRLLFPECADDVEMDNIRLFRLEDGVKLT